MEVLLKGNRTDLHDQRHVTFEEGKCFANKKVRIYY